MEREKFGSRLGFLLVSAGCAIGIGNVWKFPYVTGENGGGIFVGNGATANITNCTIINNEASRFGGGVFSNGSGTVNLTNCTRRSLTDIIFPFSIFIFGKSCQVNALDCSREM